MAKFLKSEKPSTLKDDVIPPLPSVEDPDDEFSWAQLTAIANGAVKQLRSFEHVARACHQASQAEQYIEKAHADLRTVLNLVKSKREEAKSLEDELTQQRKTFQVSMEQLEHDHQMIVQQKQQELQVVENDVAATKKELESHALDMKRELTVARKQAHQQMMQETKTARDKITNDLAMTKKEVESARADLEALKQEQDRVSDVISRTREAISAFTVK